MREEAWDERGQEGRPAGLAAVAVAVASVVAMAAGPAAAAAARPRGPAKTAYVADAGSATVTPINTATKCLFLNLAVVVFGGQRPDRLECERGSW